MYARLKEKLVMASVWRGVLVRYSPLLLLLLLLFYFVSDVCMRTAFETSIISLRRVCAVNSEDQHGHPHLSFYCLAISI